MAKTVRRFSTHGYHDTSIGDLEQCVCSEVVAALLQHVLTAGASPPGARG